MNTVMDKMEASKEEWRRLFEAAIRFKRQGCWRWMADEDYFAITDPESGEFGYCVVLGAGGTEYGLNVYVGPTAGAYLQQIRDSFDGLLKHDAEELMFDMNGISVTFEDRDQLDKDDLRLIRELEYKFRGSHEWPQFRDYKPGFAPWGLHGQQVRFLTHALEQAMLVAERFREDPELYFNHDETEHGIGEKRLHRVPEQKKSGIEWRDEWLPWRVESAQPEPYVYPDEVRLKQAKKTSKNSREVWETDFGYAPFPIGDKGERPYYPRLCLWVDRESEMIMDARIAESADCRKLYVEQLLALLEKARYKPARLEAGSVKAFFALKSSADKLGIPIRHNPRVTALLLAKEAINEGM